MKGSIKGIIKKIARERIDVLLGLAEKEPDPYSEYAVYYVKLARKIREHYKIRTKHNKIICKNCNAILVPGRNSIVKIASNNRYIVYICKRCRREVHIPY